MKQITADNSTILVLSKGEELISSLAQFASQTEISSAWLSGLGAAEKMTIGYYDLGSREYVWTDIDEGVVEILSLTGNLSSFSEKPHWHIHGVFSRTDLTTFGGHIKEMYVGLTCEIHITELTTKLKREQDDTTGLNLICTSD